MISNDFQIPQRIYCETNPVSEFSTHHVGSSHLTDCEIKTNQKFEKPNLIREEAVLTVHSLSNAKQ
jgi:hypothetical protein